MKILKFRFVIMDARDGGLIKGPALYDNVFTNDRVGQIVTEIVYDENEPHLTAEDYRSENLAD